MNGEQQMIERIEAYNRWEEWKYGEQGWAVEIIDLGDDGEEPEGVE